LCERNVAAGWDEAQNLREDEHQQRAHHEDRNGQRHGGHEARDPIEGPAAPHRRNQTRWQSDEERQERRGADQLEGTRQALRDEPTDRAAVDQRHPEIAAQQAPHAVPVLLENRPIQAELSSQLLHDGGIGRDPALGEKHLSGITRHHLDRQEHDRRNDPDEDEGDCDPFRDPDHGAAPSLRRSMSPRA
jgi:hypothetical protein